MYYYKIINPKTGRYVDLKSKLGYSILNKYLLKINQMTSGGSLREIFNNIIERDNLYGLSLMGNDNPDRDEIEEFANEKEIVKRDLQKFINLFKNDSGLKFYIIGDAEHGNNFQNNLELIIKIGLLNIDDLNNVTLFSENIMSSINDIDNNLFRRYSLDDNTYTTGEDFGLEKSEFYDMRCFYSNSYWAKYIKDNKGDGINIIAIGAAHIRDEIEKNIDKSPLFSLPLQIHLNNFVRIEYELQILEIRNIEDYPEFITIKQNNIDKKIYNITDLATTEIFQYFD
tara:strand:+ start:1892 stop:2743 length:852 start_codon:yes stop_codon:yes gene_type:complete